MTVAQPARSQPIRMTTASPDETRAVASSVADALQPGDVVALTGELGAGKTCFVQGAADGLGVSERVVSPTFVIVRQYDGQVGDGRDVEVVHVDVYRLNRLQEMVDLGEETLMRGDQITFIEWGDTVDALLPPDRLEVEILLGDDVDDRQLVLRGYGKWTERAVDLVPNLVEWLDDGYDGAGEEAS